MGAPTRVDWQRDILHMLGVVLGCISSFQLGLSFTVFVIKIPNSRLGNRKQLEVPIGIENLTGGGVSTTCGATFRSH